MDIDYEMDIPNNDLKDIDDIEDIEDTEDTEDAEDTEDTDNIDEMDNGNVDEKGRNPRQKQRRNVALPKKYIRDAENPFEYYGNIEFKKRFRFDKEHVLHGLLPLLEGDLKKINNRGLPIAPVIQILIVLRFYGTASFQSVAADIFKISQSTVSRIIFRVSLFFASLMNRYIKMPVDEDAREENRELFRQLGFGEERIGLPNVDGAIGCTHVKLTSTTSNHIDEAYKNRKGFFSLNVQAVVGPRMEILDIVPNWAGSELDNKIFQSSRICMRYLKKELTGILIGNSGYACLSFLFTPIKNPETDDQERYNTILHRTRSVADRTYGIWKRRFPCLRKGLRTKLECSTAIIVACAVLHNLALIYNDELPDDGEGEVEEMENEFVDVQLNEPLSGFTARQRMIDHLFGENG